MTTIIPFAGWHYNAEKINDFGQVISPPYDKVSPEDRAMLWNRHPNNAVRFILPPPTGRNTDAMTQSVDAEGSDWYQNAAETLKTWKDEAVLIQDTPAFYLYRQTFAYQNITHTRTGLFAALSLERQSHPHAHEFTFEGPKADRLRLMKATASNLSPIFLLADGEESEWEEIFQNTGAPLLLFDDPEGQRHEIIPITNPSAVIQIQDYVKERTLVIADGHHRYETAVTYCRLMEEKTGKSASDHAWGYVLALLVPISNPGLLVLPTHRVLNHLPSDWADALRQQIGAFFEIESLSAIGGESIRSILDRPGHENAIVVRGQSEGWLYRLKTDPPVPHLLTVAEPIRHLNVSILHHLIFPTGLGLTKETLQETTRYIRGEEEAVQRVEKGEASAAFLMRGIRPETVFDISQTGERMPQKSTDFYPKIPTGLILRSVQGKIG